jgi:hypothetical protein
MAVLAAPYHLDVAPAKPERLPVAEAARAVGIHEQTVWRYLRLGLLTRHKSVPGAPRKTMIDMKELRKLRDEPPTIDAE